MRLLVKGTFEAFIRPNGAEFVPESVGEIVWSIAVGY